MAILNSLINSGESRLLGKLYCNDISISGSAEFSGDLSVTGKTTTKQLAITSTADIAGGSNTTANAPLLIGSATGGHLEFDANEIMAKSGATGGSTLWINTDGGIVYLSNGNNISANNGTLTATTLAGTNLGTTSSYVSNAYITSAAITTANTNQINNSGNIYNVNGTVETDVIKSNVWDIVSTQNLGGSFYVAPTIMVTNGSTFVISSVSGKTITGYLVDSTNITSANFGGHSWTNNSLIKITGKLTSGTNHYVLGTCDGKLTANMNNTANTINFQVTCNASTVPPTGTYTINDGTVMMYNIGGSNKVGIELTSCGTDMYTYIDIYNGSNGIKPVARLGKLDNLSTAAYGNIQVNETNMSGYGIYTNNGYYEGMIVSSAGKIGGWTIGAAKMYSGTHSAWNTAVTDGIYLGNDGIAGGSGGIWYLWKDGSAKIGAMTLSAAGVLSVPAANITGTLSADRIAAGSLSIGKLSDLKVGGTNLLVGTETPVSKATTATSSYVTQSLYYTSGKKMLSELGFKANDEVTLSFDWAITSASTYGNARIEYYGKTSSADDTYIAPLVNPFATFSSSNTSGHFTTTVKLTAATIQTRRLLLRIDNSNLTLTISNLKFEKGTVPTSWTPAEDDYITFDSSSGIKVHNVNDLTDYLQVNSSGIYLYRNNTKKVELTDSALTLGQTGTNIFNTYITNSAVQIRKNTTAIAQFNDTDVRFFDGSGVADANVIAKFGSTGAQIGKTTNSYISLDYHSFQMIDKNGNTYVYFSDLRDSSGAATITENFIGDGSTKTFKVQHSLVSTNITVTKNNSSVSTSDYTVKYQDITFTNAPNENDLIEITYRTTQIVRAYTLGSRSSTTSNIGAESFTVGIDNVGSGRSSFSQGRNCSASGLYSSAMGYGATASGNYSHAEGYSTTASNLASYAEGYQTTASGQHSHAEGNNTLASGHFSHAEGGNTKAIKNYSHAEGLSTTANNLGSHAEGYSTTASGYYSHAEGNHCTARGSYSHAEGENSRALGGWSHAGGAYTYATADYSTTIGKYNSITSTTSSGITTYDAGDYSFIIGNGTADDARSNALTVDWDGNLEVAGTITSAQVALLVYNSTNWTTSVTQNLTSAASNYNMIMMRFMVNGYTTFYAIPKTLLSTYPIILTVRHSANYSCSVQLTFNSTYTSVTLIQSELTSGWESVNKHLDIYGM